MHDYFYIVSRKTNQIRRDQIREVMREAWNAYKKHAWGYDFLNPQTHHGEDWHGLGYTIIDSLDSLLLMDLKDEFDEARQWVNDSLVFTERTSFFETVIRCVGGLLTAYEQTNDDLFLKVARQLGDKLMPAFNTPTGLPRVLIDLRDGTLSDHPWANHSTLLADAGSCSIEFLSLTHHTGNPIYFERSIHARDVLLKLGPIPPTHIMYRNIWPLVRQYSLDAFGDSYFEYLLKLDLYSPQNNTFPREFNLVIEEALRSLAFTGWKSGLAYFGTITEHDITHEITHLSFFLPGTLFLAAKYERNFNEIYMMLAKDLLETAIFMYEMQPTGLGGETALFTNRNTGVYWTDDTYKLRPELVESLFYWWRTTHNVKARRIAWKIFLSIRKYCHADVGYTTIHDTSTHTVIYDDLQDSFFLSETLKYLYLIFSDDDVFSLDEYVFTTQAHPLRKLPYRD